MRKISVIVIVFCSIGLVLSTVLYLFLKGSSYFVSSFDGDNSSSNYTNIVGKYYLFNTEKTICLSTESVFNRVTANVDSLNWNHEVIAGYSKKKYFKINIATQEVKYFDTKDSLLQFINVIPDGTITIIPSIK